jgi:signal transduction histidine kinase
MDKAFSRWPSQAHISAQAAQEKSASDGPAWMLVPPQNHWPERSRRIAVAAGVVFLPAILSFAGGQTFAAAGEFRLLAILAMALSVGISVAYTTRSIAALTEYKARCEAVFDRASVAMWVEDWSAAATEISTLRRNGVTDMEGYFATRPEELRALCAKVMIKDCNAFAVEETGAPDKASLRGPLDSMLPHTDQTFVQWLVAFAQGDRFFRSEAHITTPDGTQADHLFTAALPHDLVGFSDIIVTSFDITGYKIEQAKLRAADAAMARASRISSVGALSASIAHEVNSPLAAVVANAQAARRWLQRAVPDVDEATEAVSAIVADATRAKEIVARTRAFISNTAGSMASFDIVAAAREANMLVERELRNCGAAVHLYAQTGLPAVKGDVIQTQQVFTNLLLNAAQAMADQDGDKEITLSFKCEQDCVRIDIADSGHGIDPTQLEKIFDPFYTTKPDGIGMGLAICRNCIDAQGGNIWATSNPGRGATIHFTLPVCND